MLSNGTTFETHRPTFRLIAAYRLTHHKRSAISSRIIHPFWVISFRKNRGEYFRMATSHAPWQESLPGLIRLTPPETPYWQDFRSLQEPVHGGYVAFTIRDSEHHPLFGIKEPAVFTDKDRTLSQQIMAIAQATSTLKAEAAFYSLLAMLEERSDHKKSEPHGFDEELEQFLISRMTDPITSQEMADHFGMSVPTLFKRCHPIPPRQRLLRLRLEAAKGRLIQGESIKTVAHASGFWDAYHFSKAFKKHAGCSPRQFIRGYR